MTDREKLTNLVEEAHKKCKGQKDCHVCEVYGNGSDCVYMLIANHLIANGVEIFSEEDEKVLKAVRQRAMEEHGNLRYLQGVKFVVESVTKNRQWIPVSERLPEEHDSMFAKWYDTPLWKPGMFRTTSGDVLVCVEFGEGSRVVSTARTNAGEWNISSIFSGKVTHWTPLPELPKEGDS